MRQKTFDKESWYSPSPLIHKFFRHQKLCWTKKGSPTKFFGTVREQIFHRKSWSSPHRHKRFRYQKFSETQTGPRRNFSALRQKKFNKKSWHNSLKHKIFRYPKLATHWRVPLRNFSALWDKKLLTKNRDTPPPLLYINFFDTRNFVKQRRVHLRSFSVPWENKFSIENRDLPLIGIKFFDTRN